MDSGSLLPESRNALIERSYTEGSSLRECAAAFEISHERVRQILLARGVVLRSTAARKEYGVVKGLGQLGRVGAARATK